MFHCSNRTFAYCYCRCEACYRLVLSVCLSVCVSVLCCIRRLATCPSEQWQAAGSGRQTHQLAEAGSCRREHCMGKGHPSVYSIAAAAIAAAAANIQCAYYGNDNFYLSIKNHNNNNNNYYYYYYYY